MTCYSLNGVRQFNEDEILFFNGMKYKMLSKDRHHRNSYGVITYPDGREESYIWDLFLSRAIFTGVKPLKDDTIEFKDIDFFNFNKILINNKTE